MVACHCIHTTSLPEVLGRPLGYLTFSRMAFYRGPYILFFQWVSGANPGSKRYCCQGPLLRQRKFCELNFITFESGARKTGGNLASPCNALGILGARFLASTGGLEADGQHEPCLRDVLSGHCQKPSFQDQR